MNREEIIKLAREAGLGGNVHYNSLERFAALVLANNPPQSSMAWQEGYAAGAAAEREACAKVCDQRATEDNWEGFYAAQCAEAIRARGETK